MLKHTTNTHTHTHLEKQALLQYLECPDVCANKNTVVINTQNETPLTSQE